MNKPPLRRWQRRARLAAGSSQRIAIVLLLVLAGLVLRWRLPSQPAEEPPVSTESQLVRVVRVIDGDTILIDGEIRVRLIGVDTPELARDGQPDEPLAREATDWLRAQLEAHDVRLEYDIERTDDYGRTLAFVWRGDELVNVEIVRQGFSRAETRFPFSSEKKALLKGAERDAQAHARGIWAQLAQQTTSP